MPEQKQKINPELKEIILQRIKYYLVINLSSKENPLYNNN